MGSSQLRTLNFHPQRPRLEREMPVCMCMGQICFGFFLTVPCGLIMWVGLDLSAWACEVCQREGEREREKEGQGGKEGGVDLCSGKPAKSNCLFQ